MSIVLQEVINVINEVFENIFQWPDREQALVNMEEFKEYSNLSRVYI